VKPITLPTDRIKVCVHCGLPLGECHCLAGMADPRTIVVSRKKAELLRPGGLTRGELLFNRLMGGAVEVSRG